MSPQQGQTLSHYRLIEKIGEGGMGVVWRARDTSLDRDVALKVLPDSVADDPGRLARLEREAKALAALNHPNIVAIHSIEEDRAVRFFTMELVQGADIAKLIPNGGLPLDTFFKIAPQVADALGAAHERGITHRDLKPANVMVNSEGRVKVLDFGLAKAPSRAADGSKPATGTRTLPLTREGTVVGTAPYMSPEQLKGLPPDPRSDVFSLGVMMYEMATGRRPFRGETGPELSSSILRDSPPPVHEVRETLPPHLGRVIRRCLEKDPERRYQTAKEVRNEITALKEELASAGPGGKTQPAAIDLKPARSRRRTVIVGAAAVALVIAVIITARLAGFGTSSPAGPPRFTSLAVLPFENLMNDPEQDYFVDGMQEALITDLAKIEGLRVISRGSTRRYRDSGKPIPEIAAELGVDALVEGSVLRAGGQVRITAQLIDGSSDEHLWADDYDRDLENILVLLSEVARAIAAEIEITLTPRQEAAFALAGSVHPDAHEAYLRGDHLLQRMTPAAFRDALPFFQRAVEIDPSFAQGWSRLALCHFVLVFFGVAPADETIPLSRAAAARALELDDRNAGAHGALGGLALFFDWDWETAGRELELAVRLAPTDSMIRHGYADYLGVMGDMEGSLEQVMLGRRYDPMGLLANGVVLGHLFMAGRYEQVAAEGPAIEERFPGNPTVGNFQAAALWELGRYDEAIDKRAAYLGEDHPLVQTLRRGLAEGGPTVAMRLNAERLDELSRTVSISPHEVARCYAQAGELDSAFEWLERAFQNRTPQLLHVVMDPRYAALRADPRYGELLRRIGFPETGPR